MDHFRLLIQTLSVLLLAAFGTVAAFAAPGDWSRADQVIAVARAGKSACGRKTVFSALRGNAYSAREQLRETRDDARGLGQFGDD